MVTINENISFGNSVFGILLLDCFELTINSKNDNDGTIFQQDVIVKNFRRCLMKFSYWYKFDVNMITGSGVVKILFSFISDLTRNPELRNTPV